MMGMQQEPQQPLHADDDRTTLNVSMLLGILVALYGMAVAQDPTIFFLGMAWAAYAWLTRPRRYLVYPNALVIEYGRPRKKVIPMAEISHVELLSLPIGERLRVVSLTGRRTMIMAKDLDTFREKLDQALENYQGGNPGSQRQQEPQEPQEPRVIDVTPEEPRSQTGDGPDQILDPDKKPDFEGPSPD